MSADRPPVRRFLDAKPKPDAPDGDPFRPLEPSVRIVQFGRPLDAAAYRRAGSLMAGRPEIWLRVHLPQSPDLAFLTYFPGLRHLDLDIPQLQSIKGLEAVADTLESFHFGKTQKVIPLGFLREMQELRNLALDGHHRHLDVLAGLVGLTALSLRGVTLPDLSLLLPLTQLKALALLGGGTRDLGLMTEVGALEELSLVRINGLSDLSILAELVALRALTLDWMRNVTELPSFAPLDRLERVAMETMKGLTRLEPVAAAPRLRELDLVNMPQLGPPHFACLVGHPTLTTLRAFPGGWKAHDAISALFPGIAA